MILWATILVLLSGLLAVFRNSRSRMNYPPGPNPIFPFFGNIIQLFGLRGKGLSQICDELFLKYGPIVFIVTRQSSKVFVQDIALVKKLLSSKSFENRYFGAIYPDRLYANTTGLVFNCGESWREIRRFTIKTLKEFGFGRKLSMENAISKEISGVIRTLDVAALKKQDIRMRNFFHLPVLNILWGMVSGETFPHDDPKLKDLLQLAEDFVAIPPNSTIFDKIPYVSKINRKMSVLDVGRNSFRILRGFFNETIAKRQGKELHKGGPKDFLDVFLAEINSKKHSPCQINPYTGKQLMTVCYDLFTAGSGTTSNSLEFALLYMILHPRVQAMVQTEIDTVLTKNEKPSLDIKEKLPYTEATILEVLRMANVVPTLTRDSCQDTNIDEYYVPKGTTLMINIESIHMSKLLWEDPEVFRPERFLDPTKSFVVNSENIVPFGFGKRVCIGETLARATIFLFFTSLLQKYSIFPSQKHPLPTLNSIKGIVTTPQPYYAEFVSR